MKPSLATLLSIFCTASFSAIGPLSPTNGNLTDYLYLPGRSPSQLVSGNVHFGTEPSINYPFSISTTPVLSSGTYLGTAVTVTHVATESFLSGVIGNINQTAMQMGGFSHGGTVSGLLGETRLTTSGSLNIAAGFRGIVSNSSTGSISSAQCIRASGVSNSGGGTIGEAVGVYAANQTAGSSNYGFYSAVTQGANKYSFYDSGAATAQFSGDVNIGGKATLGSVGGSSVHRINGAVVAAAAQTATLTNSPVAGNPSVYLKININGTDYIIPGWTAP